MDKKGKKHKAKIIIEGITQDGKVFRPSDWAERVCGNLSTFKNQRIYYSPLLRPSHRGGNRCVVLDPQLRESHPTLYEHIMDFAHKNNLKVERLDVDPLSEGEPHHEKK